jgi:molybdopterin-guanine dinucleotide biosynthesis protein A
MNATASASFHKSNLGQFGESLPADMNGYVHLTADAWLAAPVDMPAADRADVEYMREWAESQAEATREAAAAAEESLKKWQSGNARSEAYNTGYEAAEQGEENSANPYPAGSYDADEWIAGWNDAE